MTSPTEIRTPDAETEALAVDCAATAAAAARVRLAGAHDCTAVEARLRRAVVALRAVYDLALDLTPGYITVKGANRICRVVRAALREIGGDA